MNDKPFPEPIRLKTGPRDEKIIRSAWEGLEALDSWAAERDGTYRSALRACRDALDGIAPAHRASRALRNAAQSARYLG